MKPPIATGTAGIARIREIIRKEIIVAFRDPRMRVLLFLPPLIQLIIFGYAVNLDVELTRVAWMDGDRTPESRLLASEIRGSSYFDITHRPKNDRELEELMNRGHVLAAVRVLPGFGRDLSRGRRPQIQVLIDGSNSNTASIASGYLNGLFSRFSEKLRLGKEAPFGEPPGVTIRSRVWFNEQLRSQDYFVPGVVVNIIGLVTVMLTAMAVVREKEIGTMEQLMVTPIRPLELMLGKTLPFALVGLAEMVFVTTAALLVFQVPFRGSPLILLSASLLFVLTTLGTGLFISTISGTQQQAMMGSFFFFLPAFLLSGFAFPIRNMPETVQWLTYLNPMRYFLEIVRGVFLKGNGLEVLWPQMAALAVIGAVTVLASALRFRKRVD